MREFLYRLVQRLHDEARPLSRNKHFHAFGDSESRRALRIDRHLRDLEARRVGRTGRGRGARGALSTPAREVNPRRANASARRSQARRRKNQRATAGARRD